MAFAARLNVALLVILADAVHGCLLLVVVSWAGFAVVATLGRFAMCIVRSVRRMRPRRMRSCDPLSFFLHGHKNFYESCWFTNQFISLHRRIGHAKMRGKGGRPKTDKVHRSGCGKTRTSKKARAD